MQPKNIDEYIAECRPEVRSVLEKRRATIRKAVPNAQETICYRMPTFAFHGVILHFAAFKQHIGVFPPVHGEAALMEEIAPYAGPKGNLRFPLDKRIPYRLIGKIAKARARENLIRSQLEKRVRDLAGECHTTHLYLRFAFRYIVGPTCHFSNSTGSSIPNNGVLDSVGII